MRNFSPLLTLTRVTNMKTPLLHFSALHTWQFYVLLLVWHSQVKITTRSRRQVCRDLKVNSTVPNPLLRLTRMQRAPCKFIQHGASWEQVIKLKGVFLYIISCTDLLRNYSICLKVAPVSPLWNKPIQDFIILHNHFQIRSIKPLHP